MNWIGLYTIFKKEFERTWGVFMQAVLSPVISTVLYFVVFGTAIGSQIGSVGSVSYAQYIVPGLIMMALITNSMSASSSGIYFQKFIGTIIDVLSAPLSYIEIVTGYALAAMSRAIVIGMIIYVIAFLFTNISVAHPLFSLFFAILTSIAFALFGLTIGLWAKDFEQLAFVPTIILTPLSFLGGIFYSVDMLPPFWQNLTMFNPIFYMISGLRWGFFGEADVSPIIATASVLILLVVCAIILRWMFRTGYKIKS